MNNTKVTKRKGSKTKKDKESAEVFVLPPNLLQQLGINLGNIGSALENTTESQDLNLPTKEKNATENRLTPKKQKSPDLVSSESSIIETAQLMKKSVFLSPTFVSHNTNVIQGEIEIVGIGEPASTEQKVSLGPVNNVSSDKKMEEASRIMEKGYGSVANVYPQNSASFFLPNHETTQCLTTNVNDSTLHDNQMKTILDDHADEAYSSDCSNSNIGCPVKPDSNKSYKNKINIISEQIIHPSELYKLKSCFPSPETPLINVPINTMIKSHNKNNDNYENALHIDTIPNLNPSMESSGKTVGNEYKKSEYLFAKMETTEKKILDNVTNKDTCGATSSHSEFIIFTPNSENSDKDGKILQVLYEEDAFIKDKVDAVTGIVIPYHIDAVEESNIMNKGKVEFPSNLERYSNRIQVEMNENVELVDINSCLDSKAISFESDTVSNYSKSEVVVEEEEDDPMPHVIETENRNKNIKKMYIETHIKKCYSLEQKNDQIDKIQNGETGSTHYEINKLPLSNDLANQSITEDLAMPVDNPHAQSESNCEVQNITVYESESSRDTSFIKQYKQDKNELAIQPDAQDKDELAVQPVIDADAQDKDELAVQPVIDADAQDGDELAVQPVIDTDAQDKDELAVQPVIDADAQDKDELAVQPVIDADAQDKDELAVQLVIDADAQDKDELAVQPVIDADAQDKDELAVQPVIDADAQDKNELAVQPVIDADAMDKDELAVQLVIDTDAQDKDELAVQPVIDADAQDGDELAVQPVIDADADRDELAVQPVIDADAQDGDELAVQPVIDTDAQDKNELAVQPVIDTVAKDTNELAAQPVIGTLAQSPIKQHKTQNVVKFEPEDDQYKHKRRVLQNNESCEMEIISNENYRYNDVKVECKQETSVLQEDKIKEIAKYFSKFAEMQKRKKLNNKQKTARSKTSSYKNRSTYSKSSIQGVEKPGGSKINSIKTYGRIRAPRQNCEITPECIFKNSSTDSESINLINSCDDSAKEMELCLCDDFGRLAYYDGDNSYEHIHFWNNAKSDCPPDIIFSIYNEDAPEVAMLNDGNVLKEEYPNIEYSNVVSQITDRKLCWNELKAASKNKIDGNHDRLNNVGDEEDNINEGTKPESLASHDRQKIGKQPKCKKKIIANSYQNCDSPINNVIPDEHPEKSAKKRKLSIRNEEDSEPSAKKLGNVSRRLSGKTGRVDVTKDQISTNVRKTYRGIAKRSAEDPSTFLNGTATNSNEHDPKLLDTDNNSLQPSFVLNESITNNQSSIPVNDANNPAANDEEQSSSSEKRSITEVELDLPVKTDAHILSPVYSKEPEVILCGVCEQSVEDTDWIKHIASQHNYLAWKYGEPSLDVNNEDEIRDHLSRVAKSCGGLECANCGLIRKYVKAYLSHIRRCKGLNESQNDSTYNVSSDAVITKEEPVLNSISDVEENDPTPADEDLIKCAVCEASVQITDWNDHIRSQHDYLAWKVGEAPIDVNDEAQVRGHLHQLSKTCGGLTCSKCGLTRKYVRAYLSHIKSCDGLNKSQNDSTYEVTLDVVPGMELRRLINGTLSDKEHNSDGIVKCGVCGESVQEIDWYGHIASQHDYLAWRFGDSPLDINDEAAVKEHLYGISKACEGLTCSKCGLTRKYVKAYLSHIRSCAGSDESQNDTSQSISTDVTPGTASIDIIIEQEEQIRPAHGADVKCAVCREIVPEEDWYSHISSRHGYLAWKFGEFSLDVNNEAAVLTHLQEIAKACGGLTCSKCGLTKTHARGYLSHFKNCSELNESQNVGENSVPSDFATVVQPVDAAQSSNDASTEVSTLVKCAVCAQYVLPRNWSDHRASRHNRLAWACGEQCLDINDNEEIRAHLHAITNSEGFSVSDINEEYVKCYADHIKFSHGVPKSTIISDSDLVKCGVCGQYMVNKEWESHIATAHEYLAWKDGEPPLDLNDEEQTRLHFQNLAKKLGGLTCHKCGLQCKYAKSYLQHVNSCTGVQEEKVDTIKCGVCYEVLAEDSLWMKHLREHNYLAWKDGATPLDLNDEEQTRLHFQNLAKKLGGLTCHKCGLQRKYAKSYLQHVNSCTGVQEEKIYTIKCGVCYEVLAEDSLWMKHLREHNYLAWKDGATPLDFDNLAELYQHLYDLSKELGRLACKSCGKRRKYVKPFLQHVQSCDKNVNDEDETRKHLLNLAKKIGDLFCAKCGHQNKYVKVHLNHLCRCGQEEDIEEEEAFKCGQCGIVVRSVVWEKHISDEHNYLAWKDGDTPPQLDDEEQTHQLLYNYSKQFGGLVCRLCGVKRKYVKSYLEHIKTCSGAPDDSILETSISEADPNNSTLDTEETVVDFTSGGTCAVCTKEVPVRKWIHHTQREHNYLAWREGEKPWNIDDFDDINRYLYVICKRMDGLTCNKCGIVRKYVKTYLTHIKSCNVTDSTLNESISQGIGPQKKDLYQCAMCKEYIKPADWKSHAMKKHYNITWIIGETPIDIKNPYGVERFLKEYKQVHGWLKCNTCGIKRVSFAGFYAHIITCGKTDEEIEMFKELCEICNNKYLCIYKSQHAMIHKVQDYNAELKMKRAEEVKEAKAKKQEELRGKRRAAVKARSVIEKYRENMSKYAHTCQTCGYGTDLKEELDSHKCEVSNEKDFSGDDSSVAEFDSSDESLDSDVDSNISNEANQDTGDEDDDDDGRPKKRIRFKEPAPSLSKITRIPFKVEDPKAYIRQGDADFCTTHFTHEILYPQWKCEFEDADESDLTRYLPPLEQSCKIKLGPESDWTTLQRFGAKRKKTVTTIFVGASIVCITWVPLRLDDMDGDSNFLAIACHNGPDCPRYEGDETKIHENFIQIWDCHASKESPEFAFGIAHDFGTVWSMDWCPSGARDVLSEDTNVCRLGLLAVACSSGSVYIFSVPYPNTVVKNEFSHSVYKLKPVAELRMTTGADRKSYQATSVSWSKQSGHSIVLAGYADGSTAYYDLHSKSPLLWTIENNVEVFYPYHDERPHNTCITGADLYPTLDSSSSGAGVWSSPTGVQLAPRAGAAGAGGGAARARLHVATLGVTFAPHACCAVLAGDDAIMHTAITELAWVQPGRRIGAIRSAAGCARCGRVAASMPPTIRVLTPHPAYSDLKKQVVGLIEMSHLSKKRKKQVNDELAMTIEPLTYADTIAKYGIDFQKISKTDRTTQQQCTSRPKAHCPERFPLADVKSLAFCPSRKHHDKLAVATHSGILFLMNLH